MTNEPTKEPPEAVRKIVEAMVSRALAECDRLGIAWEDFYRAMLEEEKLLPKVSLEKLFERTFRRLDRAGN
jgi:hypothetical protein